MPVVKSVTLKTVGVTPIHASNDRTFYYLVEPVFKRVALFDIFLDIAMSKIWKK